MTSLTHRENSYYHDLSGRNFDKDQLIVNFAQKSVLKKYFFYLSVFDFQIGRQKFGQCSPKGAFTNYFHMSWVFFDHIPTIT